MVARNFVIKFVLIWFYISSVSPCDLPSKWKVSGYTLDLSVFESMGLIITGKDAQYSYSFSPANNLIPADKYRFKMLAQFNKDGTATNLTYATSIRDQTLPSISFTNSNNIKWTFQLAHNLTIEYICDPTISNNPYMEFTNIIEVVSNRWLFEISSAYFCPNNPAPISLNKEHCIWNFTDYTNSYTYTLTLTQLYNTTLTPTDYPNYYTVCANSYPNTADPFDSNTCSMFQTGSVPSCYWDPKVQPTHNTTDGSWTFVYNNTGPTGYTTPCTIVWVCDPTIDKYYVDTGSGAGTMKIATKYACNNYSNECYFQANGGREYGLDLSQLAGLDIYGMSDDSAFSIEYSPCSNSVKCNDKNVMAIKWNVEKRECEQQLGMFEGNDYNGYDLTYDTSTKQWKFVYQNGGLCGGMGHDVLNIYYDCNQNISDWEVTKVAIVNKCEYSIYIDTAYACTT